MGRVEPLWLIGKIFWQVLTPTKGLNDNVYTTYNYTLTILYNAILYRNIAKYSDMTWHDTFLRSGKTFLHVAEIIEKSGWRVRQSWTSIWSKKMKSEKSGQKSEKSGAAMSQVRNLKKWKVGEAAMSQVRKLSATLSLWCTNPGCAVHSGTICTPLKLE